MNPKNVGKGVESQYLTPAQISAFYLLFYFAAGGDVFKISPGPFTHFFCEIPKLGPEEMVFSSKIKGLS